MPRAVEVFKRGGSGSWEAPVAEGQIEISWSPSIPHEKRRCSSADLDRVAREHFIVFPRELEEFYRARNGGVPTPGFFAYRRARGVKAHSWVEEVCPVTRSAETPGGLSHAIRIVRDRQPVDGQVPCECVAVGFAAGSNPLVVFWRGPRKGQVWLKAWDDLPPDSPEDDPGSGMYRIASDWWSFLRRLRPEAQCHAAQAVVAKLRRSRRRP